MALNSTLASRNLSFSKLEDRNNRLAIYLLIKDDDDMDI